MSFDRKLTQVHCVDEKLVAIPYSFRANVGGVVATCDTVLGACVKDGAVTHAATGKHTFQLTDVPYAVITATAAVAVADTEDLTAHASVAANGLVTIKTLAGTSLADTTANAVVSGVIIASLTDRTRE